MGWNIIENNIQYCTKIGVGGNVRHKKKIGQSWFDSSAGEKTLDILFDFR